MTPYTRKLQQALLEIGHQVEGNKDKPVASVDKIEELFYKFLTAEGDMRYQAKAAKELIGELVRWEMENV